MPDLGVTSPMPGHLSAQRIVAQSSQRAVAGPIRRILPAIILLYAMLLPDEVRVTVGSTVLYAPRIVYVAAIPWIVSNLVSGRLKFKLADWLIFAGSVWMPTSFMLYYGFENGIIRGTALGLDVFMPYVFGRLAIQNLNDFRRLLVITAPGILIAGLSMLAESYVQHEIVRPAFARIFSPLPRWENGLVVGEREAFVDYRFGILRVAGPFSQPIIGAAFMSSFLVLYVTSGLRNWPLWVGLMTFFFMIVTFSSSGTFLLTMALIIYAYDAIQRNVGFLNWKLGLVAVGLVIGVAQGASNRGVWGLLAALSYSPETAYFRREIWTYGSRWALKHPLIGAGFTPYDRPRWMVTTSVDHYWLLLAMRHGLIEAILLMAGMIAVIWAAVRALPFSQNLIDRRAQFGLLTTIGALFVVEFTFFLFGAMQYWHYLLIGIVYSISLNSVIGGTLGTDRLLVQSPRIRASYNGNQAT